MKPFILLTTIILFALTLSTPAFSGTLYKWNDENGVFHMSDQPPPEDVEHKKSKYKDTPQRNQHKTRNLNYKPIIDPNKDEYYKRQEERRKELERERAERAEKRKIEAEERKGKREVEAAKRNYEFLKSQEEKYRAYYHEAKTTHYRNYWYKKMKSVDEARSKYISLKNKYGE